MNNQTPNRRNGQQAPRRQNPNPQNRPQNPRPGNAPGRNGQQQRPVHPVQNSGRPTSRQQTGTGRSTPNRPDPRTMTPEQRARYDAYRRQKRAQEEQRRAREEAERRAREREKELRAIERKETLKIIGGRMLVFFGVLLILAGLTALGFWFFFNRTPDETDAGGKITYTFGGEEVRKIDLDEAIIEVHGEDRIYVCFNDLARYIGMAESGSAQEMKFILNVTGSIPDSAAGAGDEEMIVFTTDKTLVTINGQQVAMKHPNILRGEEIWVESGFFDSQMLNLSYKYDEKTSTVAISMIKDEIKSKENEIVYFPVSFKLKPEKTIEHIEEDPLIGDVQFGTGDEAPEGAISLDFINDLSEYEEYMNPSGDKRDAFLTLVNTKNTLTQYDLPTDLVDCKHTSTARQTQQLREYAAKALDALYMEMKSNGFYNMAVYSGFRDYNRQAVLFESYTNQELAANPSLTREQAETIVLTYSTRAGTSEHQTGLAVDMDTMGTFSTDFAYTAEYAWLQDNAWKFGFILRFPADKTDITTIQFEPWHYRYVGRYHAQKIHASGLCLEEYVAQLGE